MSNSSKKTHPMVLVAATALTVFSLLGSAAITGLIPTTPYAKQGLMQDAAGSQPASHATNFEKPAGNDSEKHSHMQNHEALINVDNEKFDQPVENRLCHGCGVIISIKSIDSMKSDLTGNFVSNQPDRMNVKTAYLIKVRMENGGYRLLTQYSEPQHGIGDIIKLDSKLIVNA